MSRYVVFTFFKAKRVRRGVAQDVINLSSVASRLVWSAASSSEHIVVRVFMCDIHCLDFDNPDSTFDQVMRNYGGRSVSMGLAGLEGHRLASEAGLLGR